MTAFRLRLVLAGLVSGAMLAPPAFAQIREGAPPKAEPPRAAPGGTVDPRLAAAKPMPVPQASGEQARGAPAVSEQRLIDELSAVGHRADGTETSVAPSDALLAMIKAATAQAEYNPEDMEPQGAVLPAKAGVSEAEEPAEGGETDRQVFGSDDRVQIKNSQAFPFSAIGWIVGRASPESDSLCSGTLIGPRTVLTAAHCVYSHEDKKWLDNIIFLPGVNGGNSAPFGIFEVDTAYVLKGFLTNWQGAYDSVMPWDLAVMTLKEPAGESVGYLGFANVDELGAFKANIVGYPTDKPQATMWRSTCDVTPENVEFTFIYFQCDTFPGSSGSAVYTIQPGTTNRVILGVNIAQNEQTNTGLRLNAAYYEWVSNLYK